MKRHFDDFVYGSIDGAVTIFVIVTGVAYVVGYGLNFLVS
jgi:hypothetical protein